MTLKNLLCALAAIALTAVSAAAHDFWIEPTSFQPKPKERVSFDLKVGEHFVGESVARNPERIVRFVTLDAAGKDEAVIGFDGKAPAGLYRTRDAGLLLVGYRSNTTAIELESAKFEAYLKLEGLEHVIEARKAKGQSEKKGLEVYSRCAKSLLLVGELPKDGGAPMTGFDQKLGFTLEVVPEKNPYALKIGDEFPVVVYYQGKPLEHALVGCMAKSAASAEVRARTDKDGRVTFKLAAEGAHLVRVVHMVPAPAETGSDWESLWASLTFEVPVRAATPRVETTK